MCVTSGCYMCMVDRSSLTALFNISSFNEAVAWISTAVCPAGGAVHQESTRQPHQERVSILTSFLSWLWSELVSSVWLHIEKIETVRIFDALPNFKQINPVTTHNRAPQEVISVCGPVQLVPPRLSCSEEIDWFMDLISPWSADATSLFIYASDKCKHKPCLLIYFFFYVI